jgi:hypothetical protein
MPEHGEDGAVSSRHHKLKTWPEPFQAVVDGIKTYEIRHDDRAYAVGDTLELQEWNPCLGGAHLGGYTGRKIVVHVVHMTHSRFGLPSDLCVMGIKVAK